MWGAGKTLNKDIQSYELLDFGDGRKLERFGEIVLNRPCPAAERLPQSRPELWAGATARFRGPRTGDGSWTPNKKQWEPAEWDFVTRMRIAFDCSSMCCLRGRWACFRSSGRIGIGLRSKLVELSRKRQMERQMLRSEF